MDLECLAAEKYLQLPPLLRLLLAALVVPVGLLFARFYLSYFFPSHVFSFSFYHLSVSHCLPPRRATAAAAAAAARPGQTELGRIEHDARILWQ